MEKYIRLETNLAHFICNVFKIIPIHSAKREEYNFYIIGKFILDIDEIPNELPVILKMIFTNFEEASFLLQFTNDEKAKLTQ